MLLQEVVYIEFVISGTHDAVATAYMGLHGRVNHEAFLIIRTTRSRATVRTRDRVGSGT